MKREVRVVRVNSPGCPCFTEQSLERLVNFIGCPYKYLLAYLNGFISLEELLQPTSISDVKVGKDSESHLSPDAAAGWMKSLSPENQLLVVSQGFQLLQGQIDNLVKAKAKERTELLLQLLFGSSYPERSQIEDAAEKLDISVEDLRKLCDLVFGGA